jgi:hypothetical protein
MEIYKINTENGEPMKFGMFAEYLAGFRTKTVVLCAGGEECEITGIVVKVDGNKAFLSFKKK